MQFLKYVHLNWSYESKMEETGFLKELIKKRMCLAQLRKKGEVPTPVCV